MPLTPSTTRAHDSACLQTTGNGIGVPNSKADDSASLADFLRPPHGCTSMGGPCRGPKGPPALGPVRQPARFRSPDWRRGAEFNTASKEHRTMRHPAPGTPAHTSPLFLRLTVYRALRLIVGPARAFRLTLGRA